MMTGRYVVGADGRIVPDEGARALLRKRQSMLVLAASGRAPDFLFDPEDKSYWELTEFEDGQITLRQVERSYIERNWPNAKPDVHLHVDWHDRSP